VQSIDQFLAFLLASFLLIQIPGPSLLFTIGRALSVGRREAMLSVLGNALGLFAQATVVALGLGAIVAASEHAHDVLRLLGAAYIVWLGVQTIRNRSAARIALLAEDTTQATGAHRSLLAGFIVGSTNPKTLVFFASFLPQFVDRDAATPVTAQMLILGFVFAVMGGTSDAIWATIAGRTRDWFAARPTRLDALGSAGGAMMIALGAYLALADTAPARR